MRSVKCKAYSKINLFLDVTAKYPDGYHEVRTVMQTVSLADDVEIELDGMCMGIILSCDDKNIPTDEKNIAWKAANIFLNEIKEYNCGIKIKITKRIPVEAGMGGGSADAAAVLVGLNKLFEDALSFERLLDLGASLGADVPFCMVGGTAYADGKGDKVYSIEPMPDCFILIAQGQKGVSTPWAYRELDRIFNDFDSGYRARDIAGFRQTVKDANLRAISKNLYNVFEEAIVPVCEDVKRLKDAMFDSGALGVLMSGSGSAVYGIYDCEDNASDAKKKIDEMGCFSYIACPVGKLS